MGVATQFKLQKIIRGRFDKKRIKHISERLADVFGPMLAILSWIFQQNGRELAPSANQKIPKKYLPSLLERFFDWGFAMLYVETTRITYTQIFISESSSDESLDSA